MSEKDLLMLGSVPLDTPEEVFQICGRTIGEYLPWMPDGETDERISWVNMLAYRVYHGHPDIETVKRPPREMTPALVVDNVAGAEFCETEEPRAIDSFGLVTDLQERPDGQAREVVTWRESRAAEVTIRIEVSLLAPVADV
jgi:hypothetical protein